MVNAIVKALRQQAAVFSLAVGVGRAHHARLVMIVWSTMSVSLHVVAAAQTRRRFSGGPIPAMPASAVLSTSKAFDSVLSHRPCVCTGLRKQLLMLRPRLCLIFGCRCLLPLPCSSHERKQLCVAQQV